MFNQLLIETTSTNPAIINVIYASVLSFVLATLIAFTYEKTFRGLSYSRNFVQALVMCAIVAASVMQAIGDSLASGLGMMGALAIIRFRTSIKDPKDIAYMFAALGAGISCGVHGYEIAVVGTTSFCLVAFILYYSPFGEASYFDGMLRFNIENTPEDKSVLEKVLKEYCKKFSLVTLRDMAQGRRLDYAYHVKLKNRKDKVDFLEDLKGVHTIKGLNFLLQETTVEL